MALRCLIWLFLTALPSAASAPRDICAEAADHAAREVGVPAHLLTAITLVETQRDGVAWPWTLNHRGKGAWFQTRAEARTAIENILSAGGSADVGCFQINTFWHQAAFRSADAMLDPQQNALYAARYLASHYRRSGNWAEAVGDYHSRDPERGAAYLARVTAALEGGALPHHHKGNARVAENRFPLLMSGDPAAVGSIVPRLAGQAPLYGAP